jgi:hypothetical protein
MASKARRAKLGAPLFSFLHVPFTAEDRSGGAAADWRARKLPPQTWVHLECNTVVLFLLHVKLAELHALSSKK